MIARLLAWIRRDRADAELDEELRAHLAMATADRIARGESPDDARLNARKELGNVGHIKEVTRETWGRTWLDVARQDLRYAVRALRRALSFTLVAVATLALGIGASTAMFAIVDGIVLRPLPYASATRVVALTRRIEGRLEPAVSDKDFAALAAHDRYRGAFAHVATINGTTAVLLDGGDPINVAATQVTNDFFAIFDLSAARGRVFAASDAPALIDRAVVLSDRLWRSRYNADPNVIGRSITVDSVRREVIGVMPPAFDYPAHTDLWYPFTPVVHANRTWLRPVVARIADGLTLDAAQTRWNAIASQLRADSASERKAPAETLTPLRKVVIGETDRSLLVASAAVLMVLLIACVNVANLLLMRVTTRDREMAVRAALGARRSRIVRQLLTESLLLSAVGAAAGLTTAIVIVKVFIATAPPFLLPRLGDVHLDWRVLAFAAGAAVAATLACGLAPALHAAELRLQSALVNGARTATSRHHRVRALLAAVQIALAVVLVTAAGLLARSFTNMTSVKLGFTPQDVYIVGVNLPDDRYRSIAQLRAFDQRALTDLAALPGVEDVAVANWLPFTQMLISGDFHVENYAQPIHQTADRIHVSPGYFRALGLPIVAGRAFTGADGTAGEKVAIITRSMAKAYWADGNPIGKRIAPTPDPTAGDWLRVVGVVDDVVQNDVTQGRDATIYEPLMQADFPFFIQIANYVVRAPHPSPDLAARMRATLLAIDPRLPPREVTSMESMVARTMLTPRFQSRLFIAFSAIALALALIGVYGVLAYNVAQSRREHGIRLALGASAANLRRRVLGRMGMIALPGTLLGIGGSLAVARVLRGYLFQIEPNDPGTLVAVCAIVGVVALVAAYVPARRAGQVDPIIALRDE